MRNRFLFWTVSFRRSAIASRQSRRGAFLAMKGDRKLQAHVDDLAARHSKGRLSPAEEAEYGRYVSFCTFVAILKSKARQLLAGSGDE